jgi:hypothetical protein
VASGAGLARGLPASDLSRKQRDPRRDPPSSGGLPLLFTGHVSSAVPYLFATRLTETSPMCHDADAPQEITQTCDLAPVALSGLAPTAEPSAAACALLRELASSSTTRAIACASGAVVVMVRAARRWRQWRP